METAATGWCRGRVKSVLSGDCLVIMPETTPLEKIITLSSLVSPRLAARRGCIDEAFALESREFLRKFCIGKEVTFKVDYTVETINQEFGSVFLGDQNLALLVVSKGWAKIRDQGQQKGEASPYLAELLKLEEQAKTQGLGCWRKDPLPNTAYLVMSTLLRQMDGPLLGLIKVRNELMRGVHSLFSELDAEKAKSTQLEEELRLEKEKVRVLMTQLEGSKERRRQANISYGNLHTELSSMSVALKKERAEREKLAAELAKARETLGGHPQRNYESCSVAGSCSLD